jgi:eukaryotic-like serine/threonine-protein kinase
MATAPASKFAIGSYEILRHLGSGAMGEVYLAHDPELGRDIALKLLPTHLAQDPEHLTRLRQEARTASSLSHPNIVTIYEIGNDGPKAYMAMEYIEGQTLREVMDGGPLPVRKVVQLAAQIADGLAAAHKRGLIHRDLKPENIMVTAEGMVKIFDFGLAKAVGPAATNQSASGEGTIVGTYAYMSPEQARAAEIDHRSDQFSFGAMLYEMLSGRRAFDAPSGVETLFLIVRDEPAPLSAIAANVPPPVRWIVDRCLSKDVEDRYASTRDLARDLQYIRDHFSEAGIVTPLASDSRPRARVASWTLGLAAVAALAIGAAATAWLVKPEPRPISSARYLTYSGQDYSPAVSPDGKLIAFSSRRDDTFRIWIKQVDGGGEVPLTAGVDDFPRFSPDGSSVLYINTVDRRGSLYRIPVVGGEPRRIVENAGSADWSPDGNTITFSRNAVADDGTASTSLFLVSADGSNVRELAKIDTTGVTLPRWSPDGKWIAVIGARGRVAQTVTIIDAKTGTAKTLREPPKGGEVSSVVWTANSKSVIYVRASSVEAVVGSNGHLIKHDIEKDKEEIIGWTSHNATIVDIIGDGRLVMDVRSPRDNLREINLSAPGQEPSGIQEKWITRGNSSDRQPVYSPDGQSLLFSSNRSGNLDLWIMNAGGVVRRVTDDAAEDWDPAFFDGGKKILWSSGRSGNLEIWMANVDGSNARQVSKDGFDAENPAGTPDGKWILYNSFNAKKAGIWKIRSDGSQATHLVQSRTSLPEISADGQYLAYIADGRTLRAAIRVVRVADGKDMGFEIPMRNTRRTSAILGRTRWMPDGKSIAFLAQDADGVNGVFVQDFVPGQDTTATRRKLGGFERENATESFGISPDGTRMTVASWEQLFSLYSIDGVPEIRKRVGKKES